MKPCCRKALRSLCGLLLSGCALRTPDQAPDLSTVLPAAYAEADRSLSPDAVPERWWVLFQDPALDRLVPAALLHSSDLTAADADIRAARASVAMVAGGRLPQLDAAGRIGRDQLSRDSENFANVPFPHPQTGFTDYRAGFDASWEIDLFGHAEQVIAAADARRVGVEQQRRDTALRIAAEVTRGVIEARAWQLRLDNAERMLARDREIQRLTRLQQAAGLASEADLELAGEAVPARAAAMPTVLAARESALAALAVLLDAPLATVRGELAAAAPIPLTPEHVPVGLPGELLQRRPDVRMAERALAAASADLGVARAEQYPRLVLVGNAGWDSITPGSLGAQASRFWNIGPQLSLPLLSGGRLQAQADARTAARDAAIARYRQAILAALGDVETALIRYREEGHRLRELRLVRDSRQREVAFAEQRQSAGEISQREVLAVRQQLASLEDQLLGSQQALAEDLVALFKALGGGFAGP